MQKPTTRIGDGFIALRAIKDSIDMPIETDVKKILKHRVATNKSLKEISAWQVQHGKDDDGRFKKIEDAIGELPNTVMMAKAVADSVQKTVNGNLKDIEIHLGEQDKNMETLSKKVAPLDGTRKYIVMTGKVLAYILSMAIGVSAVIEIVKAITK